MKTFTGLFTALSLGALLLTGCVNEEPPYKNAGSGEETSASTGYLSGAMSLRVIYDSETDTQSDDTQDETQDKTRTAPATDDYRVKIANANNANIPFEGSYAELKAALEAGPMELPVGNYELSVCSHRTEEIPSAAWNDPVYSGSYSFSISKGSTTPIEEIVCTLQNIKVTLLCSADLAAQLANDTKAIVSLGSASLEFGKEYWDGQQAAFFMPEAETNDLEFLLSGTFVEGGEVKFSKKIPGVRAGQWRKIELVIAYADQGNIKFDIQVDSFVLDDTITINGSEGLWESIYEERPIVEAPTLGWTGHELGEPFQLKASMFDGQNHCSEPFEITASVPGRIARFDIAISSTSNDFMQSLRSLGIEQFDLCTISGQQATILQGFGFPVGEGVKGQTAKTFYIGGQLPWMLYAFDGTHTFDVSVTDEEGQQTAASLILRVDKANEEGGSDNAPTVVMQGWDITQPYELATNDPVRVDISAPNGGIQSLLVRIESTTLEGILASMSDVLTGEFDLCEIDAESEEGQLLKGAVGFQVGDEVKGQPSTFFEIPSEIIGALKNLSQPGESHKFHLKVIDNAGGSTSATLTLVIPAGE